MITFEEIAAAARKLPQKERERLVDLLQEPVSIPDAALAGIEAGLADIDAGRVATPGDFAALAGKLTQHR